jgi:hypothetical protein
MKICKLKETIINDLDVFVTIDIESHEQLNVISMFHARKEMLEQTNGIIITKNEFTKEDGNGIVRAVLEDGKIIELVLITMYMV